MGAAWMRLISDDGFVYYKHTAILWIMDFSWKQWIENILMINWLLDKYEAFHKVLIDALEWRGLLVDYCGFF